VKGATPPVNQVGHLVEVAAGQHIGEMREESVGFALDPEVHLQARGSLQRGGQRSQSRRPRWGSGQPANLAHQRASVLDRQKVLGRIARGRRRIVRFHDRIRLPQVQANHARPVPPNEPGQVKADLLSIESHKIEACDREIEVARQGRDLHERVGVDRLVRQVRGVEQKKIHCICGAGRVSAQRPTRAGPYG